MNDIIYIVLVSALLGAWLALLIKRIVDKRVAEKHQQDVSHALQHNSMRDRVTRLEAQVKVIENRMVGNVLERVEGK